MFHLELTDEQAYELLGHLEDDHEGYDNTKWEEYDRSLMLDGLMMRLRRHHDRGNLERYDAARRKGTLS